MSNTAISAIFSAAQAAAVEVGSAIFLKPFLGAAAPMIATRSGVEAAPGGRQRVRIRKPRWLYRLKTLTVAAFTGLRYRPSGLAPPATAQGSLTGPSALRAEDRARCSALRP